jgi:hypothetical protein
MNEYKAELISQNENERVTRFSNPDAPGCSVIVRENRNFQLTYEAYRGEELIRSVFDDQTPLEDKLSQLFAELNGECPDCGNPIDDCDCECGAMDTLEEKVDDLSERIQDLASYWNNLTADERDRPDMQECIADFKRIARAAIENLF